MFVIIGSVGNIGTSEEGCLLKVAVGEVTRWVVPTDDSLLYLWCERLVPEQRMLAFTEFHSAHAHVHGADGLDDGPVFW